MLQRLFTEIVKMFFVCSKRLLTIYITLSIFIFQFNLFAIPCKSCEFNNAEEDRYCLQCATPIVELSEEERQEVRKKNLELYKKRTSSISKLNKLEKVTPNFDYSYEIKNVNIPYIDVEIRIKNNSHYAFYNLKTKIIIDFKVLQNDIRSKYSNGGYSSKKTRKSLGFMSSDLNRDLLINSRITPFQTKTVNCTLEIDDNVMRELKSIKNNTVSAYVERRINIAKNTIALSFETISAD